MKPFSQSDKLILSVLLIVLIGITGWVVWPWIFSNKEQKTAGPEQSSSTVNTDTSHWEIFENKRFGYSIKYPFEVRYYTTYGEKSYGDGKRDIISYYSSGESSTTYFADKILQGGEGYGFADMDVEVKNNQPVVGLASLEASLKVDSPSLSGHCIFRHETLNTIDFLVQHCTKENGFVVERYYVLKDGQQYVISVLSGATDIARGMVSSFTFLPKRNPANDSTEYQDLNKDKPDNQKVIVKQIEIKSGLDLSQPFQDPPYKLLIADGHYLLWVYEGNKLVYDGKEIYAGENLGGIALSRNGLHYAYVVRTGDTDGFNSYYTTTSNDLYINNKRVTTAKNLVNPAVTDDGRHYFYTLTNDEGALFKDGKEIFRNSYGPILYFLISSDGSTYFASLKIDNGGENSGESLVVNGEEIYRVNIMGLARTEFSKNGRYYAYAIDHLQPEIVSLVINGDTKRTGLNILSRITDLGYYAAWDPTKNKIFINGKEVFDKNALRVYINEDASHYLISTDDGFLLDGNPIQLKNINPRRLLGDIEIVGNIVYVYGLVK